MALLLLPLGGGRLLAQQGQAWPTDDSYSAPNNGQYPADPQSSYGQQQYAQQPQYAQPQYPQQPYQGQAQGYAQQDYQQGNQQAQPLNAEQLEQLVAPIALYPDNLLAQVLAASTYPAQVAAADQWRRMQGNAPADQIAAGADAQTNWDPSIKALTAFPQVLAEMDQNLRWTTDLGNAYYNQPQDVMQTIQVMRDRAQAAGTLQSTPQEQVNDYQGNIELAPADPQTVYVPSYNPWDVYGQPVSPYPGFSPLGALGSFFGSSPLQYGMGVAMQAFSNTSWGWLGWGLDWLTHSVLFNQSDYFTRSNSVADWGFPRGGPRAFGGRGEMARLHNGNGWEHGGYPRPRSELNRDFNRNQGQGWNHSPERYGDNRFGVQGRGEGFNRGHESYGNGYGRLAPPQQAYNRMPEAIGRPQQFGARSQFLEGRTQSYPERSQQFGRSGYGQSYGYGSGFYSRQQENSGARSGMAYANPSYRYSEPGYRGNFGGQQYGGSYGKQEKSGGFHWFGHGHDSQSFSGGRAYGGGGYGGHGFKSSGGGWKAPKPPKASHFGGGGHEGGHSGGGHSGRHHH